MDFYQETFETWDKIANIYQEKFMDLAIYNESYFAFCEAVNKKNPQILDIGCGPGNISKNLLSQRPDMKLLGIDVSLNMVELARKNNPTATFEVMDARNLNNLKLSFDGIVAGFCLPYFSETDGKKFIADCANLLNNQGIFYLSFVNGHFEDSGFKTGHNGLRAYFNYYPKLWLENLLKQHGFTLLKTFEVPYPAKNGGFETHNIFLAKKST